MGTALLAALLLQASTDISLVCRGAGDNVQAQTEIRVELAGGQGRIQLPRNLLPTLRGGIDGWFNLSNIQMNDDQLRATVHINPLNNPHVELDRHTGHINIFGKWAAFNGDCQRYDRSQERLF